MAKGDADKVQNQVDTQGGTAQNTINNLMGQNTDRTTNFQNLYQPAATENVNNYHQVQGSYDQFLAGMPNSASLYSAFLGPKYAGATATGPASSSPSLTPASDHPVDQLFAKYGAKDTGSGSGVTDASYWKQKYDSTQDPYYLTRLEDDLKGSGMDKYNPQTGQSGPSGPISSAISGYQNFADTGGFSPQDIADIRARAIAPIRSMNDRNNQEVQRQAAIRGTAYSPNTTAAISKMNRDSAYAAGDTATNAEAMIAQLMQQGKLYGLGGLSSTGLADRGLDLSGINASAANQLGALQGKTNLYGATPGLTNTFGNQVLNSAGQGIQVGGLQNQLVSAIINGQIGKSNIPGNFQSGLGNVSSGLGLVGNLVKGLGMLGGGGGSSPGGGGGGASLDEFGNQNNAWDSNNIFQGMTTYGDPGGGGEEDLSKYYTPSDVWGG